MSYEFTTSIIQVGLLVIAIAILTIIFFVKQHLRKEAEINLSKKNEGRKWSSPLEGRNKYPEVDLFKFRGTFLNFGLMASLVMMIFAFGWTQFEEKTDLSQFLTVMNEEIEIETPRTAEPPPPPPPPPPAAVQIVASDLPLVETVVFKDQSIDQETAVEAPVVLDKKPVATPPPPPPPPPVNESEKEIFKVVEEAPAFPGCEAISDKVERQKCAETALMEFIYKNIQYPLIARENGVEGMVVIQFVVERDGSVTNISIVRDIGAGCGEEATRIVKLMPPWNPGKQRGMPVRVQFTLPVRFKLA
jgi:protein TonB